MKLFNKKTLKVVGFVAVAMVGTLIGTKALKKSEEPAMIEIKEVISEDEENEEV